MSEILSQLANLGPDLGQTRVRPDTPIGSGTTTARGPAFVHEQSGVCVASLRPDRSQPQQLFPLLQLLLLTNGQLQVLHERFGAHSHALNRTYSGSRLLIETYRPTQDSPVFDYFSCRMASLRCLIRYSYAVAMELQNLQCFARLLQSYRSMCTENYSDLVELLDCDRLQIISMTTSADFWPRLCSF